MSATVVAIVWYLRFVETLSLAIALILVALAYRGYKKHGSRSTLSAAAGFAMLGVASLTEGILFDMLGMPLDVAHAVRSTLTAFGLIILLYSIHVTH